MQFKINILAVLAVFYVAADTVVDIKSGNKSIENISDVYDVTETMLIELSSKTLQLNSLNENDEIFLNELDKLNKNIESLTKQVSYLRYVQKTKIVELENEIEKKDSLLNMNDLNWLFLK